jgi:hypothetical protein
MGLPCTARTGWAAIRFRIFERRAGMGAAQYASKASAPKIDEAQAEGLRVIQP